RLQWAGHPIDAENRKCLAVTPRRHKRSRITALAALTILAVSACGSNMHPGAAAVVDDTTISQGKVDDLVLAACDFTRLQRLKQGGAQPSLSVSGLRSNITGSLISYAVAHKAADHLHLSISDSKVGQLMQAQKLPKGLSTSDHELLKEFFTANTRSQVQQAVIAEHLKDPSVTSDANVQLSDAQAAADYMKKFTKKQDVVVNPSYGTWSGTSIDSSSGSLSSPVSSAAKAWAQADGSMQPGPNTPSSQTCG
ncbi:MAG: SurA N-terminal domain-containing protein, partial [Nocardioidaceae bacterium]